MEKLKKIKVSKGITLIALVVTIVVLLILAGVSISMLTGENGIIKQAQESKEKTKIGEEKEAVGIAYSSCKATNLGENVKAQQLEDELKRDGKDVTVEQDGENLIVTYNDTGRVYTINQNGEIEESGKTDIIIKLALSYEEQVPTVGGNVVEIRDGSVPIPTEFHYVEGGKNTGLVIADEEGNEFVWVPVNQNQKLTLEVKSKDDITGIKVIGPDGGESSLTASGKTFSEEITMTKNGVYTVEVTTATTTKTASKRITSLYAQDSEMDVIRGIYYAKNNASERYSTTQELLTAKSVNSIEELLTDASADSIEMYMIDNDIFIDDQEEELKAFVRKEIESRYTDNNQNRESVNKYGGFYIARYEAGDGTTTSRRTSSTSDTNTLVSKKGAYVYNYVNWETSRTLSSGMYASNVAVTSQLITGAGWARTLNWIIETGNKTEEEVINDSRSWGNYLNSTGNAAINSGNSNINYTTGRSEYWKANNIYDLAGNTCEWTQEQNGTFSVIRGGDFGTDSGNSQASYSSDHSPTNQTKDVSFRTQLYINV